jgi:zona occludens toxin (predicted ATPase)
VYLSFRPSPSQLQRLGCHLAGHATRTTFLARLVLFNANRMKKLLALFVIALAACYYMGYEPVDFIPSFGSNTPPPKVRRAEAQQTSATAAAPQPAQRSGGSTVTAGNSDDGSLEHRWIPRKP